jgi:hypothetical protein
MTSYDIRIGFAQIECQRCKVLRVRGVVCPDCGDHPDPREVDPNRQERASLARQYRETFESSAADGKLPDGFDEISGSPLDAIQFVLAGLGRSYEAFLETYATAVADSAAEEGFLVNAADRGRINTALRGLPHLRPYVALVDKTLEVQGQLTSSCESLLVAMEASTPIEAQGAARTSDESLKDAIKNLSALGSLVDRLASAAGGSADFAALLAASATDVIHRQAHGDLMKAEEAGHAILREHNIPTPRGLGIGLLLVRSPFELRGDAAAFMDTLDTCVQALTGGKRLTATLGSQYLISDLLSASRDSESLGFMSEVTIAAARNDREICRVLLGLAHDLIEGPAHTLAAAVVSTESSRALYDQKRTDDTGALFNTLAQSHYALAARLHLEFRHAFSHANWDVVSGQLVLDVRARGAQRPRYVTVLAFVDQLMELQETITAGLLAVRIVAEQNGVSVPTDLELEAVQLAPEDQARTQLLLNGFGVESSRQDASCFEVHAKGDLRRLGRAGVMAASCLTNYDELAVCLHDVHAGDHRFVTPTEPARMFRHASSDDERTTALFIAGSRTTLDGERAISRAFARKWLGSQSIRAIGLEASGYPLIRRYRELARTLRDTDADRTLGQLIRLLSMGDSPLVSVEERASVFSRLSEWSQDASASLPFWWHNPES